jgi:hypothetical protein
MRLTRSILLTGLSLAAACQVGPPQGDDGSAGTQASDTGTAGTEASDTGTAGTEESDTGDETGGSEDALECLTLLVGPWPEMGANSSYVTPDGRVLLAGSFRDPQYPQSNVAHAWVGAFDVDGTLLWSRDFGPGWASTIHPRGEGFAFLYTRFTASPYASLDFVSLDADGNVDQTVVLSEEGVGHWPEDWIETASGVLLGGSEQGNFWLGRLDGNGAIETLVQEDYAGFDDGVMRLARYGDVIGALVDVGLYSYPDLEPGPDAVIGSTLLVEYDEQGVELQRTLLAMPGETIADSVTWNGKTLDVDADGTWIVSGEASDTLPAGENYGWVTAVRDGEILWTYETPQDLTWEARGLATTTVTDDILLAGWVTEWYVSVDRSWFLHLDSGTGELLSELVGPVLSSDPWSSDYIGSGVPSDGRVRLVGKTTDWSNYPLNYEVSYEHWLCTFVN